MNQSLFSYKPVALHTVAAWFAALALALTAAAALAYDSPGGNSRVLQVPLYKSRLVEIGHPAKRVSVGNPEVADILILRSDQLYVVGKKLGSTNVLLWDGSNHLIDTVDVEVTHDLDGLKEKLHQLLPGESINVHSSQGAVVLSGQVSDVVKMESAVQLARSFAMRDGKDKDPPVLNLLQVGGAQQVMLEVKVAEMARTLVRSLSAKFNATGANSNWKIGGVNGGATFPRRLLDVPQFDPNTGEFKGFVQRFVPAITGGPASPIGPDITTVLPNDLSIEDKGLFATLLSKDLLFNLALDAAQERGLRQDTG